MNSYEEDYTSARKRFSTDNFDCELPPDARREFERPKRPRVLGRPPPIDPAEHAARTRLYLTRFVVLMLAAGLIAMAVNHKTPEQLAAVKEAIAKESATPAPAPPSWPEIDQTPGWHSDGTAYGRAGVIGQRPAPRATLVRLPAPRAELVSIPVGGSLWITMPYNERVFVTYTGHVPSFETLPRSGNFMGETRVAADTNIPWVWTVPPGGVAQWVDP